MCCSITGCQINCYLIAIYCLIIITDFFVICIAGIVLQMMDLSPEKPVLLLMLYSFLLLVVSSQIIDIIIFGFDYAKSAFIISDKHEEIAQEIMDA